MKKRNFKFVKKELNMRSFLCLMLFVLLVCVGCGKSGAPSCGDESVKGLVLDISTGEIKNQLLKQTMIMSSIRVPGSYDDVKKIASEPNAPSEVGELIAKVDEQIASLKIGLINVRTNSKQDDIKKCECAGDLSFANGESHPITYAAQFTEDEKIHVSVVGLQ